MQIHQLVPALHEGDAIGDSARAMRDYLRACGFLSDLYAYTIDETIAAEAIDFRTCQPEMSPNDVLILHFALPSGMTEFLKRSNCRKAIIYHNITPSYYWLPYDRDLVHLAYAGRKELASLAPFIDRAAGDSEYNRQELEQLHFKNTCVLPIYVPQERYKVKPSQMVLCALQDEWINFLFVGRVAPNKKLEDVLKLVFHYRRLFSPLATVIFVGKTGVAPSYLAALRQTANLLQFMPDEILFTGHVDWSELVAYYKASQVFVSMSEHEGFCVPLVEAMICNIPILAYSTTAIPFTLGQAGVQFTKKEFPVLAGVCHHLIHDSSFREEVLQGQREQLRNFSPEKIQQSMEEFLAPLI